MGDLSIWHWIVVIAVVMLLFGRGNVSDLMGDLAQGIKAFKNAVSEDDKPVETLSNGTTYFNLATDHRQRESSDIPRQRAINSS